MPATTVHVAVGVIVNSDSEVLISKRAADVHQANCWEFPGGKLESNETAKDALARELKEEIGVVVQESRFLSKISFDYGDKKVCLHTFMVTKYSGCETGAEGQPIQWVKINQLQDYNFPEANLSIINQLQLPDIIQITGEFISLLDLISKCEKCIEKGIKLIHFRAHHLNDRDYEEHARMLLVLCQKHKVKLTLNRSLDMLSLVDADGLHMTRHEMKKYTVRPCAMDKVLSVSCHNADELRYAEKLSVDYCYLSPVKPALSHNAGVELGLGTFSELNKGCTVPVYALGGMSVCDVSELQLLGAKGVAIISDNWI